MQTGAVKVPKTAQYVGTDADGNSYNWAAGETVGSDIVVLFDGDGKAKSDTWDGDKYYAKQKAAAAYMYVAPKASGLAADAVTNYAAKNEVVKKVKGALVKNAFVNKGGFHYVDGDGYMVKNSAIEVGEYVTSQGFNEWWKNDTTDVDSKKAYVLFNSKGVAYTDVQPGEVVKVGSKKYVATSETTDFGIQVFYYNNVN